ncbi:MAG: TolC family protein, partial [Elusimicrobia bacterium]|nr:TolC family protein [Elusimicrobiota bacterium]
MNMNLLMTGIFLTASSFAWSANKVDNVVVTESEDGNSAVVVIESKEPLKYTLNQTEEPPLAEIYLEQDVSCEEEPFQQAGKKLIKEIKLTCQRSKSKSQGEPAELLRSITLVLDQKCSISFSQKDWILSLTFQRETSKVERPVGIGEVLPLGAATPAGVGGTLGGIGTVDLFEPPRMTLSSRPGLDEFVQVGLANHRPLEIAQSELKLARRKHFESKRNFFPVLSGRGTQTEGTTQSDPNDPATRADFNRKEIGLEIGQPLFQSGRLYYSEKQAGVQKEISEWQISKLTLEVQFEVTKSLYAYLSAKENLAIRKELVSQSEKILDTTSKKKEIGVASESEYLGVLSSNNQIAYKAVSQEKDMEIAKSRLMGVLNVDLIPDDAPIEIEPIVTRAQGLGLDLNRLVALAMTNR